GSTPVSCWLSVFVYGSSEIRRETTSQFDATTSARSALTMSLPAPQSTRSMPPHATWTRSLPPRRSPRARGGRKGRRRGARAAQPSRGSRGCAPDGLLGEHARALATHGALELVRDAGALPDDVRRDGAVAVWEADETERSSHCSPL